jgi:hypothetical protein
MFERVRSERDGPLTDRLLAFVADRRAPVRPLSTGWPSVADAAESALSDADPQVRRSAARLLVHLAGPDRAVAALDAPADPVVRIALTRDAPERGPAVSGEPGSAAVGSGSGRAAAGRHRDVRPGRPGGPAFAGRGDPGRPRGLHRGARALDRTDRAEACCTRAGRLAGPAESPPVRLERIRMAVAALRAWRAPAG